MDLSEYQRLAGATARYPSDTSLRTEVIYCALKLAGEAGEYAEKIGKIIRDKGGEISTVDLNLLILELGDVLWYVAQSASELGEDLDEVARLNLLKLESRAQRNMIKGSGDHR